MTVSVTSNTPVDEARARGAAYSLIACVFQYPDRGLIEALRDPSRWSMWPDVLRAADVLPEAAIADVRKALAEVAGAEALGPDGEPRAWQRRYDALFGHAVRGACPAYEMEYSRGEIIRLASELADLAGFYRAFGLDIVGERDRRPDHVAVECEFMSALCAREAHAVWSDHEEQRDICADAQRAFLRDHLARWMPAFCRRVTAADASGLYGATARLAEALIAAECRRFDIHAGPPTLELRPADPVQDRQIACGPGPCGAPGSADRLVPLGTDIARSGAAGADDTD